jgi:hypothetical protein
VVDLSRDGWAVVCAVSPVNFTLRSGPERDVLLAGFARWLHSLASAVQILTRTHPVDLSATITGLHRAAARLPHPALAAAASAHADHLNELGSAAELLHREFLIVFRTPTPIAAARIRREARASSAGVASAGETAAGETASDRATRSAITQLRRRVDEAVGLLGGIGLRVTPLDPAEATRVLRSAMRPDCGAAPGARQAAPGPRMPGFPPRPAVAQAHPARGSFAFSGPRSARDAAHRGEIRTPGVGVGVGDEPTIELDLSVDAAVDPAAARDDDEIERGNVADAVPAVHDASDRAEDIAAAITAALTPHRSTEHATATGVGVGVGVGGGDVAVAEDMTLDGDDEDGDDDDNRALTLEEESRHDVADFPETSPAGQASRRGPRPVGVSNRAESPARAAARRASRAGRGPAPRSTGRRP